MNLQEARSLIAKANANKRWSNTTPEQRKKMMQKSLKNTDTKARAKKAWETKKKKHKTNTAHHL